MAVATEQINIFIMGMVTAVIIWGFYSLVVIMINGAPARISEKQKHKLIDRLQSHGFSVYQLIIASDGLTPEQARDAMLLRSQGCLVFSDSRGLEGYLFRPRLTSSEEAELRRSQFKLVVSNKSHE